MLCKPCVQSNCVRLVGHSECDPMRTRTQGIQRYIAALFPVFFEILKWLWLLRFPLAPRIDPHHPPYRFATPPVVASIGPGANGASTCSTGGG
jgi:hypothetical protein